MKYKLDYVVPSTIGEFEVPDGATILTVIESSLAGLTAFEVWFCVAFGEATGS